VSRASVLLSALTDEPTTTSDLYDRVGYGNLACIGLIPYEAFRAELIQLSVEGLVESDTARDGSTVWKRTGRAGEGSPR
jgi:hypothetical protein